MNDAQKKPKKQLTLAQFNKLSPEEQAKIPIDQLEDLVGGGFADMVFVDLNDDPPDE